MTKDDKILQIKALIEHYSNGKNADFAQLLGISPQGLSTWLNRGSFDIELIYSKCEGISSEWLLAGKGEMLEKNFQENVHPKMSTQNRTKLKI